MELTNIEKLLDSYFEGTTTLEEETQLKSFFASENVPEHLQGYVPLFESFIVAKKEYSEKTIELPKEEITSAFWKWGVAASLTILLGFAGVNYFTQSKLTQEEEQALMAYQEARSTMLLLSQNLNKGASKINYLNNFTKNSATVKLVNQFAETKNKYLK